MQKNVLHMYRYMYVYGKKWLVCVKGVLMYVTDSKIEGLVPEGPTALLPFWANHFWKF